MSERDTASPDASPADSGPEVVTIDNLANGGDGAGRLADGRIVFVPRTIPGERVEIELTRSKKAYAFGRLLRILEPSPERVEPACPHFGRCGGCQFWHMTYSSELLAKTRAASEAIARVGGVTLPEPELLEAPSVVDYRARATFHRRKSTDGSGVLGFFAPGTNRVVDIAGCPIADPLLNAARDLVAPAVRDLDAAEVFIETAGEGQVVVTVHTKAKQEPFDRCAAQLAELVGAHETIRGAELLGGLDDRHLNFGEPVVDATEALVAGLRHFVVPAGHFRQANPAMNRKLVARVRERLASLGGTRLLELFAGMGNFTLALASDFERIWAIEAAPVAVQTGRALVEADRLDHIYFKRYDLADGLEGVWPGPDVDVVLLDPPRGGAAEACADLAKRKGLKGIVYVSCDAACLGRDLKTLAEGGWRVRSLDYVDLFPRTTHVETIAVLTRGEL